MELTRKTTATDDLVPVPFFDYIVIERLPEDEKLIFVPNADRTGPKYARVVALGDGRPSEYSGTMMPSLPLAVGDTILFHGGAGTCVRWRGIDYWYIKPADVMAVMKPRPTKEG